MSTVDVGAIPRRGALLGGFCALPVAAGATGAALVAVAESGTAERPFVAAAVFALGAGLGLMPLRIGLSAAVVLMTLTGFLIDFVGTPAVYWNEAFVTAVALRSFAAKRPTRRELAVIAGVAGLYASYLVAGSEPDAVFWASKVLLTAVVLCWALARHQLDGRTWAAVYLGLAFAVGVNLTLAVWQRTQGVDELLHLGLPLSERVREGPGGVVRSFGGFTTQAPFSYALAFSIIAWTGFVTSAGHARRLAFATAWVPVAAVAGIVLSLDRTVIAGLVAAAVLFLLRRDTHGPALVVGSALAVTAVALFFSARSSLAYIVNGFRFDSPSTRFRVELWGSYASHLSAFGVGPGSAGAAYRRLDVSQWSPPVTFDGWDGDYTASQLPIRAMESRARVKVEVPMRVRPPLLLRARATSADGPRRLSIAMDGRHLADVYVPAHRTVRVRAPVPSGTGAAVLAFRSRRTPELHALSYGSHELLPLRFVRLRIDGLPLSESPALRIFERIYYRTLDTNAVAGIQPGVVDNLYLSWLFQYGVLVGGLLCLVWVIVLVWPSRLASDQPAVKAASLAGVFMIVAAIAVNAWEESPVDFLVALMFAHAFAITRNIRTMPAETPECKKGDR